VQFTCLNSVRVMHSGKVKSLWKSDVSAQSNKATCVLVEKGTKGWKVASLICVH
jgi:hypothetical protein